MSGLSLTNLDRWKLNNLDNLYQAKGASSGGDPNFIIQSGSIGQVGVYNAATSLSGSNFLNFNDTAQLYNFSGSVILSASSLDVVALRVTGTTHFSASNSDYMALVVSGGINFGAGGSVASDGACVLGGRFNRVRALSRDSAILSGFGNTLANSASVICGGSGNVSTGLQSVVCGGLNNSSSVLGGAVVGGIANSVRSIYSFVGGGQSNVAGTNGGVFGYASVVCGFGNTAYADLSFIGGGESNRIYSSYAAILHGYYNVIAPSVTMNASAKYSTILGGLNNLIYNSSSVVCGGSGNFIFSEASFIGAGCYNSCSADSKYSFVGSGYKNKIATLANSSSILGGGLNTVANSSSVICGGSGNVCNGEASSILGGLYNTASAYCSHVFGYKNAASPLARFSTVLGTNNTVTEPYSVILGGNVYDDSANKSMRVGINTTIPRGALEVHMSGTSLPDISGLSDYSLTPGCSGEIVHVGSTIAGASMAMGQIFYYCTSSEWAPADAAIPNSGSTQLLAIACGTNPLTDGMLIRGWAPILSDLYSGSWSPANNGQALYIGPQDGANVGLPCSSRPSGSGQYVRAIGNVFDGNNEGDYKTFYFSPAPSASWTY